MTPDQRFQPTRRTMLAVASAAAFGAIGVPARARSGTRVVSAAAANIRRRVGEVMCFMLLFSIKGR